MVEQTSGGDAPLFKSPLFRRVALIGIGLIGSSLARRIHRDGLAGDVVCAARTQRSCEVALELGLVSAAWTDPVPAVEGADLVVLCAPVGAYADLAAQIGRHLKPGTTVTDVGSVKQAAVRDIGPHLPEGVH